MHKKTLQAVASALDGNEWTPETPQAIANIVNEAGFHVERSFGVPVKVGPAGLSDEEADQLRGLKVALAECGGENGGLQERIDDLESKSEGIKVMCGACGSTEFRYEESHPCARTMAENDEDGLVFHSSFEWYEGDDDPGVVCASWRHDRGHARNRDQLELNVPSYRCSIEIEVTASNALEAAEQAEVILDEHGRDGYRFIWSVLEFEGPNAGASVDVDLDKS